MRRTFLLAWRLYRRAGPLSAFGHFPQRGKQGLPGHQPLWREGEWRALREAPPTGCPELHHTVGADSIRPPCGSLSEALGLSRRLAAVTEGVRLLPSAVSREIDGRHLPQGGRLWASSRGRDPLTPLRLREAMTTGTSSGASRHLPRARGRLRAAVGATFGRLSAARAPIAPM